MWGEADEGVRVVDVLGHRVCRVPGSGVKADRPFWLDGGYDFDSVRGCRCHPDHEWGTFRLGDILTDGACGDPDELMTFCVVCFVPRCGTTDDGVDRCKLWRHHETAHVFPNGAMVEVGAYRGPA